MNDELNSRSRADYSLMRFIAFLSQICYCCLTTHIIWLKVADKRFNSPTKQSETFSKE